MEFLPDLEFALAADKEDTLNVFRNEFYIPCREGKELVYFCGNSLGLQPKTVKAFIEQELNTWATLGVDGHFSGKNPWAEYHKFLQPLIAEIAGAKVEEVVPANSLTVNLHLMLTTFYKPVGKKRKILVEANPFSSDYYALESQAKIHGLDPADVILEIAPDDESGCISPDKITTLLEAHKDEIALVLLGAVNYATGQAFPIQPLVAKAQNLGIPVGLDLAHAIGNIPLKLHDWEIDFAVWCSYKYLNSGPGSTGGYFIHQKHIKDKELPRLAGWWGYNEKMRFKMQKGFDPIPTAEGWQLSNAPVLPMAAKWASLEIFRKAGMGNLRAKSKKLTGYLEYLLQERIIKRSNSYSIKILTPSDPEQRGCQLSLKVGRNPTELFEVINQNGFVVDFRSPDIIRVTPVPLYNRFIEVYQFVSILEKLQNP